jgi:hypothetical protein
MKYKNETEMYPDVCRWLKVFLESRFRQADIEVHTLATTSLSRFLRTHHIRDFPPEWVTWDIKVDVVGIIRRRNQLTALAFVECKNRRLTLSHLSQLLGYSRIALPIYSFLISPMGLSSTLISLLKEYQRLDVLEYHRERGKMPRRIVVAQWDGVACNLNSQTIIPAGAI